MGIFGTRGYTNTGTGIRPAENLLLRRIAPFGRSLVGAAAITASSSYLSTVTGVEPGYMLSTLRNVLNTMPYAATSFNFGTAADSLTSSRLFRRGLPALGIISIIVSGLGGCAQRPQVEDSSSRPAAVTADDMPGWHTDQGHAPFIGGFVSDSPSLDQVFSFERRIGRHSDFVLTFMSLAQRPSIFPEWIETVVNHHTSPVITIEPWNWGRTSNEADVYGLGPIVEGRWDSWFRQLARQISESKKTVYIRFAHEMNEGWYSWGKQPDLYTAAWSHVRSIFREEGASTIWIWNPNADTNSADGFDFQRYFPKADPPDIIGWDGYSTNNNGYMMPSSLFAGSIREARRLWPGIPQMILETSIDRTGVGNSKADAFYRGLVDLAIRERLLGIGIFNVNKVEGGRLRLWEIPEGEDEPLTRLAQAGADIGTNVSHPQSTTRSRAAMTPFAESGGGVMARAEERSTAEKRIAELERQIPHKERNQRLYSCLELSSLYLQLSGYETGDKKAAYYKKAESALDIVLTFKGALTSARPPYYNEAIFALVNIKRIRAMESKDPAVLQEALELLKQNQAKLRPLENGYRAAFSYEILATAEVYLTSFQGGRSAELDAAFALGNLKSLMDDATTRYNSFDPVFFDNFIALKAMISYARCLSSTQTPQNLSEADKYYRTALAFAKMFCRPGSIGADSPEWELIRPYIKGDIIGNRLSGEQAAKYYLGRIAMARNIRGGAAVSVEQSRTLAEFERRVFGSIVSTQFNPENFTLFEVWSNRGIANSSLALATSSSSQTERAKQLSEGRRAIDKALTSMREVKSVFGNDFVRGSYFVERREYYDCLSTAIKIIFAQQQMSDNGPDKGLMLKYIDELKTAYDYGDPAAKYAFEAIAPIIDLATH